uniref:PCI domain-containing protein n=1 Tax=Macrostomum lignano TaxID=282301 RepID=A0A1I8HH43_9PLAT
RAAEERSQAAQKEAAQRAVAACLGLVAKLELWLGEAPSAASSPPGQQLPVSLERCGRAYARLSHLCARWRGSNQTIDGLRPRASRLGELLERRLADALTNALLSNDKPAIRVALTAFAGLGRPDQALEIYRELTVRRFLRSVLVQDTLQQQQQLSAAFASVLDFAREQRDAWASLLDPAGLTRHFDFLGGAVFPELARHLIDELPMLFNPGNPDRFHQRYSLTVLEFLPQFQALLPRLSSLPAYWELKRKFNLAVYFQIRLHEVTSSLDQELSACGLSPAPPGGSACRLKATSAALAALSRVWCPEVHLPSLTGRFWKLTLLIICRCGAHFEGLAADIGTGEEGVRRALLLAADLAAAKAEILRLFSDAVQPKFADLPLADAGDADEAGDAGIKSAERDQLFLTALTDCLA